MATPYNFPGLGGATVAPPPTTAQFSAIQNAAGQNSLINQLYAGKTVAPVSSITSSAPVVAASSAVKNPNAAFNNTVAAPQVNNSLAIQYPSLVGSAAAGTTMPTAPKTATVQPVATPPAQTTPPTQFPASSGTVPPTQNANTGMTTMYDGNGNPVQIATANVGTNTYNAQTNPNGYYATPPNQQNNTPPVPQAGQPATIDPSLYGSGLFGSLLKNAVTAQQTSQEFNQSLQQGENDVTKQPIPLDFVQGQQAAMQRDYGVQQTALATQASNALADAEAAAPVSQYGALTSPATGNPISSGGTAGLPANLPVAAQSALSALPPQGQQAVLLEAQKVQNNLESLDTAKSNLSAYSQGGLNALNSILGSGFNTAANTGATQATAANTQAVGTAPVNAQLGVYDTQLQNLGTSQVAASQIAAFGNQLLTTMSQPPANGGLGINPYSSQYANLKLNQLQTQFNSPQYATFNTNIAGLQARVSSLLQTGEIPSAATQGAQDIVSGNATLASMQATLQQIDAEAGAITGSQAQVASTAFQQAQQAAGVNTSSANQSPNSTVVSIPISGGGNVQFVQNAQGVWVVKQ